LPREEANSSGDEDMSGGDPRDLDPNTSRFLLITKTSRICLGCLLLTVGRGLVAARDDCRRSTGAFGGFFRSGRGVRSLGVLTDPQRPGVASNGTAGSRPPSPATISAAPPEQPGDDRRHGDPRPPRPGPPGRRRRGRFEPAPTARSSADQTKIAEPMAEQRQRAGRERHDVGDGRAGLTVETAGTVGDLGEEPAEAAPDRPRGAVGRAARNSPGQRRGPSRRPRRTGRRWSHPAGADGGR